MGDAQPALPAFLLDTDVMIAAESYETGHEYGDQAVERASVSRRYSPHPSRSPWTS